MKLLILLALVAVAVADQTADEYDAFTGGYGVYTGGFDLGRRWRRDVDAVAPSDSLEELETAEHHRRSWGGGWGGRGFGYGGFGYGGYGYGGWGYRRRHYW